MAGERKGPFHVVEGGMFRIVKKKNGKVVGEPEGAEPVIKKGKIKNWEPVRGGEIGPLAEEEGGGRASMEKKKNGEIIVFRPGKHLRPGFKLRGGGKKKGERRMNRGKGVRRF